LPRPPESFESFPAPIRDLVTTEDPRVIKLIAANLANPRWSQRRPGERAETDSIPRAWRAKGYEPVAGLIGAWVGKHVDVGTIRSWWRIDIARGESDFLPPPDAIIKRKGGTLLPGWSDETIREWLTIEHPMDWTDTARAKGYLEWDSANDEIDPYVVALAAGNQAKGMSIPFSTRDLPTAYVALGYQFAAQVISEAQGRPIADNTITKYWRDDLLRPDRRNPDFVDAYSRLMPVPDVIVARGSRSDLLPGWSRSTIEAWIPTRPGPGNHTAGMTRRGHNSMDERIRLGLIEPVNA